MTKTEDRSPLPTDERLIRLTRVRDLTGLPRTSIYENMKKGCFPRSYRSSGRVVVWRESEVRAWMDSVVRGGQ